MARVTGIGGVFFKATGDHRALARWYETCLGFHLEDFGAAILRWEEDQAEDKGLTVWNIADKDTEWFLPSTSSFMINYRVDDLDGVIARLAEHGEQLHKGPEDHENGRFAWVLDPEGNKIELWEPKLWDEKNKKP